MGISVDVCRGGSLDNNTPVVCRACRRTVMMKDIKFDEANRQYICRNCFDATRPRGSVAPKKSNVDPDINGAEKLLKSMVRYNCPKCKYHFSRKPDAEVRECPYCGYKGVEKANKDAADKILKDTDMW